MGDEASIAARWRCWCLLAQRFRPAAQITRGLSDLQGGFTPEQQRWFLERCLRHPLFQVFPLDPGYEREVLRRAVLAAEAAGDVADELMDAFTAHLSGSSSAPAPPLDHNASLPPGWCYKLHAYAPVGEAAGAAFRRIDALGDALLINKAHRTTAGDAQRGLLALRLATGNMFEGGTGCHEWQAGHFLAEYVLSEPGLVAGRRCLELGCGAGLVGVALHRAGAAQVVCSDGNLQTLDNCAANLRLNGVPLAAATPSRLPGKLAVLSSCYAADEAGGAAAIIRHLEWERGWSADASSGPPPDVIVGADLLYDPLIIPTLLRLLQQILQDPRRCTASGERATEGSSTGDPEVLLCTLRRNETSMDAFAAAVEAEPALEMDDISAEARRCVAAGVRFCHLQAVEAPWESLIVHRLWLAPRVKSV